MIGADSTIYTQVRSSYPASTTYMEASAMKRFLLGGLIRLAYLALGLTFIYSGVQWAMGQVVSVAQGVPTAMQTAQQTRTAPTPVPTPTATPATSTPAK
jgi:hypothetical protein